MCLIVKKGTKEKVAENDIICYKVVRENLMSQIMGFKYELNILYTTKIEIQNNPCYYSYADNRAYDFYFNIPTSYKIVYSVGFHSFNTVDRCTKSHRTEIIVECTIPKGTKYVEDETGLICSEAIIINKILN